MFLGTRVSSRLDGSLGILSDVAAVRRMLDASPATPAGIGPDSRRTR
jgi:hypothetical protein